MLLQIFFAFIAGIITVFSPCILPLLPIILTGGLTTKPLGIVTGFVASFTFFTLFLSSIVITLGVPADILRTASVFVLMIFGLTLAIPALTEIFEKYIAKITPLAPNTQNKTGFWGGVMIGVSLGLLWTPCVGPILAGVISLAISGAVTWQTFVITLAYSVGTAIPMFAIMIWGQYIFRRIPGFYANLTNVQKIFGVFMIITSLVLIFGIDRIFQAWILDTFPSYGKILTIL